jgi:hypothetical protein
VRMAGMPTGLDLTRTQPWMKMQGRACQGPPLVNARVDAMSCPRSCAARTMLGSACQGPPSVPARVDAERTHCRWPQTPASKTNVNPISEVWDPVNPNAPTARHTLPPGFLTKVGANYYPNNYILPSGDLFVYCDSAGLILDWKTGKVVQNVPSHTSVAARLRMEYPNSATSVMLPLTPDNGYTPEFVFFGGQFGDGSDTTWAADQAVRIKVRGAHAGLCALVCTECKHVRGG